VLNRIFFLSLKLLTEVNFLKGASMLRVIYEILLLSQLFMASKLRPHTHTRTEERAPVWGSEFTKKLLQYRSIHYNSCPAAVKWPLARLLPALAFWFT
jgi:hypothetical protein